MRNISSTYLNNVVRYYHISKVKEVASAIALRQFCAEDVSLVSSRSGVSFQQILSRASTIRIEEQTTKEKERRREKDKKTEKVRKRKGRGAGVLFCCLVFRKICRNNKVHDTMESEDSRK